MSRRAKGFLGNAFPQVWSEAMLIEISIVLDLNAADCGGGSSKDSDIVHLCDPVKVNVLPKAVKRGL